LKRRAIADLGKQAAGRTIGDFDLVISLAFKSKHQFGHWSGKIGSGGNQQFICGR